MKILLPTSSFPRNPKDGKGRFVLEYSFAVAAKGHDITVIAPAVDESYFANSSLNLNISSFRYSPSASLELYFSEMTIAEMVKRTIIGKLFLPLYSASQTKRIMEMVNKERYDIIHSQWMLAEMNSQLAKKLTFCNIPTIVTVHGADMSISERNVITKQIYLKIAQMTDVVLANSIYTKNRLIKLGVSPEKIRIQYQGINPDSFNKVKMIEKDPELILFVGRLSQRKGVKYLLHAFKHVLESNPNTKLIIVGIGPEYISLVKRAKELKIDKSVTFIRFIPRDDLIKLFKKASVFVIPSIVDEYGETETLGVVLIEASYCKTPIVASNIGGIPEIVGHNKTGFLVKPKDSTNLALHIQKLLEDPTLRKKFGETAKKKVLRQFTWDKISEGTIKIYNSLNEAKIRSSI